MHEVISVNIGQAGCAIGERVWETFCIEHGIRADGQVEMEGVKSGNASKTFFNETIYGQFVPRTIFCDTDPSMHTKILGPNSRYRNLFDQRQILCYKESTRGNFFLGQKHSLDYGISEEVVQQLRKESEKCDNLSGLFVFRAYGGGCGSGTGVEILQDVTDEFPGKLIFEPVIHASRDYSTSAVEPYNTLLSTAYSMANTDLTLIMDNQSAYSICSKAQSGKFASFRHMNYLVAQVFSACTTSLRFDTVLSSSLRDMVQNLVPSPQFKYPIVSISPVIPTSFLKHQTSELHDVVHDLFAPKSFLSMAGDSLRTNRLLSAWINFRGGSGISGGTSIHRDKGNIQAIDAISIINRTENGLKFVPWVSKGFKVGVCPTPSVVPCDKSGNRFMAQSDTQACLMANSTSFRDCLLSLYQKYLKLLYNKSYLWNFLEAGGEMEMFTESQEVVRKLIDDYGTLLMDCKKEEENEMITRAIGGVPSAR